MSAPVTSISLLQELSSGSANARWTDFLRRYEPMIRDFLRARYPSVDADDVLQETLLALMRALPDYQYTPDAKGHFRNYLTGIVRNKATDAIRRSSRHTKLKDALAEEAGRTHANGPDDEEEERNAWQAAAAEAAIDQLMTNETISATTREVFRHVALMHESPVRVAEAFGLTRENVDQIKSRMIARLARLVRAMTEPN